MLLDIIADVHHLGDSLEAYAEALTASDKLNLDDFKQIYPPVEDQTKVEKNSGAVTNQLKSGKSLFQ